MFKLGQKTFITSIMCGRVVSFATIQEGIPDLLSRLQLRLEVNPRAKLEKLRSQIEKASVLEKEVKKYDKPYNSRQLLAQHTKINVVKKNFDCDLILMNLVRTNDSVQLLDKLIYFENLEVFPSRKVLLVLASAFARNGEVENIHQVQRICLRCYPKEHEWLMGYKHYEAEAMWKTGEIQKSVQLFTDLFIEHVEQRKKISEMVAFLMRFIFHKHLREHYQLIEQFSSKCLNENFFLPAVLMWSISFISTDPQAWEVCDKLLEIYPDLKNRVSVKFNFIVNNARENCSIEQLQRLVEFVLKHEVNDHLSYCLGQLLIMQCENETVTTALQTFNYASEMKIKLSAVCLNRLFILLIQHKHEIPLNLLRLKYSKFYSTSKLDVKW